jgi:translocation and assembly module TamA
LASQPKPDGVDFPPPIRSYRRPLPLPLLLIVVVLALSRAGPALADIAYEVTIDAGGNKEIQNKLAAASRLVALRDRPPASEVALRRRLDEDKELLIGVLRAEGYYAAELEGELSTARTPAQVTITVKPGPRYHIDSVTVLKPDRQKLGVPLTLKQLGLAIGAPARSGDIIDAEQKILARLAEHGLPLAKVVDRRAVVDHARRTMSVAYYVDPGPPARFGPVTITGNARVSGTYIRNRLTWKEGDDFDSRALEATRKRLIRTELFNAVRITPGTRLDEQGRLPVDIAVVERKPRSIGAAATWSSSEGIGLQGSWEHRDIGGHAERLGVNAYLGQVLTGVTGTFRVPDAIRPDLDLVTSAAVEREYTDAFKTTRATASTGVEQLFSSTLTGGLGVSVTLSHERSRGNVDVFTLFGLPAFLRFDDTDNPLDPTRGVRANLAATPFYALIATNEAFLSTEATGSTYLAIDRDARFVLAARGRLGTIWGADRSELPADVRFYAGGAGSVRGYAFQKLGPLDDENDPEGGRSVVEFGGEVRIKITDTIGVVPFFEGGNVYAESRPELYRFDFRYSAGLGLRYYTPIGPLRLDVAFPIDPRPSDDSFQFYVSIGQAF